MPLYCILTEDQQPSDGEFYTIERLYHAMNYVTQQNGWGSTIWMLDFAAGTLTNVTDPVSAHWYFNRGGSGESYSRKIDGDGDLWFALVAKDDPSTRKAA